MAQRPLLVRVLWFVFVGWWLTPIVVNVAWALNVTVILIPLGIKLVNLVPTALTLSEPRSLSEPESARGQPSLLVRAVYFVLVGWWLSFAWANVATFFALTIVGLPVAFWMFIYCALCNRPEHRIPMHGSLRTIIHVAKKFPFRGNPINVSDC